MGSLRLTRVFGRRLKIMENSEQELKPLRYNPALKCDPQLEAMRPERLSKHTALPTGDWKRFLIKNPPSYEGSFADADIQKLRPNPVPSAMEDPWFVSQLPQSRDQIQQIKMRNRRFQQSCGLQSSTAPRPQAGQAALAEDMMMMTSLAYSDLQRQVQMFQSLPTAPVPPPRSCLDEEFLSVDMLPTPRKIVPKVAAPEAVMVPKCLSSSRQVDLGDQIAIRSYVLGKTL